jgi:ABC-type sugar transport system ATPase subunit
VLGAEPAESGTVKVLGRPRRISSPRQAIRLGIGLAPEDRKQEGIFPHMSVAGNIAVAALSNVGWGPFVGPGGMHRAVSHFVKSMRIVTPSLRTPLRSLSGGNQQKCILARLLAADTDVLLLDEPTRGIDIGARAAIYELINKLAAAGKAVVLVSSDLTEVMGMCDRVLVLRKGRAVAEFARAELTEQAIMRAALPTTLEDEEAA